MRADEPLTTHCGHSSAGTNLPRLGPAKELAMRKILCAALMILVCFPAASFAQNASEVSKDQRKLNKDSHVVRQDVARGKFKKASKHVRKVNKDRRELLKERQHAAKAHS